MALSLSLPRPTLGVVVVVGEGTAVREREVRGIVRRGVGLGSRGREERGKVQ